MSRTRAALVVVIGLAGAGALATQDAQSVAAAAKQAAGEARYCDALHLYTLTFSISHEVKYLFNAAEVAFAAGDRINALQLYREVLEKYPRYDKRSKVEARISELGRAIAEEGVGSACPGGLPLCGNGVAEGAEKCDDGNTIDGDGCDSTCVVTACGNGIVTAGEACDDGNQSDGDGCSRACTRPGCGNGAIEVGERCDDGNAIDGDGCDHSCTPTACGNGVVSGHERCDDGNETDGDGCDGNCTPSGCGNAIISAPEECDDGNASAGDGCTVDCRRERSVKTGANKAAAPETAASALPWVVTGSLAGALGAVASIASFLPAISYLLGNAELDALEQEFADAGTTGRARIATQAATLHDEQEVSLESYNQWGRYVGPLGIGVVVTGVIVATGGLVLSGLGSE